MMKNEIEDNRILSANNLLIKQDLQKLIYLNNYICSFSEKDISVLYLMFMRFNNFILYEILEYIKNKYNVDYIKELEYKKQISKMRSKLKCNLSNIDNIDKINDEMNEMFMKMNNPLIMNLYPNLCDNFGIFFYNGSCIGNNFEISMLMKSIIYTDKTIDHEKTFNYSVEIGKIFSVLCKVFDLDNKIKVDSKNSKNFISSKDYNLFKYKNDKELSQIIFYYNKIGILNFYKNLIFVNLKEINSLNIKLKYVICKNTMDEMQEICSDFKLNSKFSFFSNIDFRNFMYHYSFPTKFNNIQYEKTLFGVCEEILAINEIDIDCYLNECIEILISYFSEKIENSKYKFLGSI